jgi:hypothetical protein
MHKDHKVVTGCSSESNDTQSCGTVLEASLPEVKNIPHHTTTLFSLGLPALDRLPFPCQMVSAVPLLLAPLMSLLQALDTERPRPATTEVEAQAFQ